jgi:hypothetical protein
LTDDEIEEFNEYVTDNLIQMIAEEERDYE